MSSSPDPQVSDSGAPPPPIQDAPPPGRLENEDPDSFFSDLYLLRAYNLLLPRPRKDPPSFTGHINSTCLTGLSRRREESACPTETPGGPNVTLEPSAPQTPTTRDEVWGRGASDVVAYGDGTDLGSLVPLDSGARCPRGTFWFSPASRAPSPKSIPGSELPRAGPGGRRD